MRVTIELQDPKGKRILLTEYGLLSAACLSDAAQQMPKKIFKHGDKYYTFHAYLVTNEPVFVFREREVISCVSTSTAKS